MLKDPPDGWYRFGTHAGWDVIPMLEFSEEVGEEDGLPLFERRLDTPELCGGCRNLGNHRRHCPRNPEYNHFAYLADRAEELGDRIGPNEMGAANHCYAASGLLRQLVAQGLGSLRR